jgi:hypothetical protein
MPTLHEETDVYIFKAIENGIYKLNNSSSFEDGPYYIWDETQKLYKYANSKYPNKAYTNTYDPKTMFLRGDVIHYGEDDYRNNNKLIFDGEKLVELWTGADDYGSVPPDFVCGDAEGDFDIGDFEDLIEHNTINWLSKDKLKEIEFYIKNDNIMGKVEIQGKLWKIHFEISEDDTFSTGIGHWGSRKFKCNIENENIIVNKKAKYIIKVDEANKELFKNMIIENPNINIINYSVKSTLISGPQMITVWYLFRINKETKLMNDANHVKNMEEFNFPLTCEKRTQHYISEHLVFNQEDYNKWIKFHEKELDKIYIKEITGFYITIERVEQDVNGKIEGIKTYFNSLVENYDNINKRHPVNRMGQSSLQMYI